MSVKRKPRPKDQRDDGRIHGYVSVPCSSGKRGYVSKSEAKAVARKVRKQGDNRLMNAYRCESCGLIHLGHLPIAVRQGEVGRREYFEQGEAA